MRSTLEPFERTIKKAFSAEVIDIGDVALTNGTSSSLRLPCTRSRRARSRISSKEATRSLSGSRMPSKMVRLLIEYDRRPSVRMESFTGSSPSKNPCMGSTWVKHGPRLTRYLTPLLPARWAARGDRKSTRLNSSHDQISYAVFCLKKKTNERYNTTTC